MNDRRESVLRVSLDVLPDIQYRPTGRIDERAPSSFEPLELPDGHAECWNDDNIFRPERVGVDASAGANDDELLAEIDSALVARRAEELRALDALTPENVNISLRRR